MNLRFTPPLKYTRFKTGIKLIANLRMDLLLRPANMLPCHNTFISILYVSIFSKFYKNEIKQYIWNKSKIIKYTTDIFDDFEMLISNIRMRTFSYQKDAQQIKIKLC